MSKGEREPDWQWVPPPGWPTPPPGFRPPPGWQPDPAWLPAPPGWLFYVRTPAGARRHRRRLAAWSAGFILLFVLAMVGVVVAPEAGLCFDPPPGDRITISIHNDLASAVSISEGTNPMRTDLAPGASFSTLADPAEGTPEYRVTNTATGEITGCIRPLVHACEFTRTSFVVSSATTCAPPRRR